MANNPTIVSASLDDKQLKDSISNLVAHMKRALHTMTKDTDDAVEKIQKSVQKLGQTEIKTSDGGVSKQKKAQEEYVESVKRSTAEVKRQNKELEMSFDRLAQGQQVAIRSASPKSMRNWEELQTMNIQLDLLRERLREARNQYSSFVALASHATTTGDKGLFRFATDGVHRYEQEVRSLIPQIRNLQSGIQQMGDVIAPQGHTIQNYVNSLQKANPELAALNAQYKSGTSLLQTLSSAQLSSAQSQQQSTQATQNQSQALQQATQSAKEYSEQVKKIAAEVRASQQWQKEDKFGFHRGMANIDGRAIPVTENLQMGLVLEEQIQQAIQRANEERQRGVQITQQQTQATQQQSEADRRAAEALGWTNEAYTPKKRYTAPVAEEMSYLRLSLQSITGMQEKWVDDIDKTKASYGELSRYVKELKSIYSDIWRDPKNESSAKAIAKEIQQAEREMQKWQQTMSRPVDLKHALGNPEKTLDDINYKIRQLQSYRMGLNITDPKALSEMKQVELEITRLKKQYDELMGKNSQMISSNTALGRSWNYMKNRLAFYFTVGASTQFVKNLIEVRSQYEMNERALGILIDSAERGTQIFNELSQMALVSPYTLIELSSAAKQLTAYDVAAKDVVDTTRRLADMAAAVGVPIERLTYALGQIKAYGYLNSRDARMFANAGIPLVKQLSDHYTELEGKLVSVADIYDRIKKKQIGYEDVTEVIYKMTDEGGKFFDFQAKMAETLKVQLANLTLAWNNMLNDIGESNQWLLSKGIGALKELFLQWENISRVLTNVIVTFGLAKASMYLLNIAMGKGTLETIKRIGALEGVTAANYRDIISTDKLTKTQARFLVATNSTNWALKEAIIKTGVLTRQQVNAAASSRLLGVRLGFVTRSLKALGLTGAVALQGLWTGIKSIGASLLSIATNPLFIAMTAAMAVTDAIMYYNQVAEKTEELNNNIAKGAKEASDALSEFLKDTVNISNRAKATQGILSASEGEKAWAALREQIELSSDAASTFITELLSITDINQRIAKGFDYAESIKDATNALAGLNAEALQVSQDSWLYGLFGEGLAEDMEDYIEELQKGRDAGANIGSKYFAAAEYNEAMREIKDFAANAETVIRDRLGAGVKDSVQLKEAVERIKKEVIAANPQIKGDVKKWFDVELDRMMAERFGNVYNSLSSLQSQFIENIKRDSGAALKRLNDDILDTSKQLDDSVVDAIEKSWSKLKDELPPKAQDLISNLQQQMDKNPLLLRVLLLEAGEQQIRDKIQKDYEKHFYDDVIGEKPQRPKSVGTLWGDFGGDYNAYAAAQKKHEADMVEYNRQNAAYEEKRAQQAAKYGEFNKKNDEDRAKWAKRITDYIKEQETQEKSALHTKEEVRKELGAQLSEEELLKDVRYAQAKADAEKAASNKKNAEEAYRYEHLYNEEKKKSGGSKKDPLLDTLKQTIDIIKKTQSEYDALTKAGESSGTALQKVYGRFSKTLGFINGQLRNFGLPEIDLSKLVKGKNPNDILAYFTKLSQVLTDKGLSNLERMKAVEVVIQEFGLKADTYNLDKITKGLNNELGKLKDEYELAVELDANPELGDMFADMFGIYTNTLPKTFGEALDRAQIIINRKLAEMNIATPFDLMQDNVQKFADATGLDKDSAFIKELVSAQKSWQDMFKKNITETEKVLDDYIKKYGDYSDKIAEIEAGRLEKLKKLNEAYYTDEMRKRPEYLAKLDAIEQGSQREKQQVNFDEFKNSRYYTMMFENLDYISTKTLRDMRDRLREYIDTAKDLTPEQLKTIISQYEKIEQKIVKRSPFKTLAKDLKEYFSTSKERKVANTEFKNAQKEYDAQKKNVAALKEKYEQAKANSNTSKSRLEFLQIEIDGENEILKILKEQLEAAQKKADKYNLTAKLAKSEALAVAQVVATNLQSLGELRDFMQQDLGIGFSNELNGFVDGLSKVGQGINKITSSASSGDVVGVITGVGQTIYGLYDGIASIFGGGSARDKNITDEIKESERAVKRLENTYKNLEVAIDEAFGANAVGAKQAAIANKELQLAELQRQLALEKSRDSKHRDEDRIIELQGQIIDLKNDIKKSAQEITTDLLGIGSVADAAMQFMDTYIEALRKGEDAQAAFTGSFKEMIASMIKQLFVTKVIGPQLESLVDEMNERIKLRSETEAKAYEQAVAEQTRRQSMSDEDIRNELVSDLKDKRASVFWEAQLLRAKSAVEYDPEERKKLQQELNALETEFIDIQNLLTQALYNFTQEDIDAYRREAEQNAKEAKAALDKVTMPTIEDMDLVAQSGKDLIPLLESADEQIKDLLDRYDLYDKDASKSNLSLLQQGIQGITEDTAGALEAYMNGVSQQVYLQSDLLTQIRDTIVGFDLNIQTATMGQILLQLQSSYAVQSSIKTTLEGVLNPSGRAFSVELVS